MRVLIIDDDKMICEALKIILEASPDIEIVGIGYDGNDAVELFSLLTPDILLMDIRMEHKNGIDAGYDILKKYPDAKIIYLTTFADNEYIVGALNMGAKGYMLKQNFDSIPICLSSVMSGQVVFGQDIVYKFSDLLPTNIDKNSKDYDLTDRELEIIKHVSEGLSNKEIANAIYLSEGTVRNYISQIFEKLNLRDRTQLVIFYFNYLK